jgi:hypothetical protein
MLTTGRRALLIAETFAAIVLAGLVSIPRAEAAETVVLKYGLFRGSVPVQDLTKLAETGEPSGRLRRYLRLANQEPEQFRQYLTESANLDAKTLDLLLNSPAGDVLLNEFSEYIYIPNSRDDQDALKTALTSSVETDGQLDLIEVLQNYPRKKVYINVNHVISTYRQLASIQERFGGILNGQLEQIFRAIDLP